MAYNKPIADDWVDVPLTDNSQSVDDWVDVPIDSNNTSKNDSLLDTLWDAKLGFQQGVTMGFAPSISALSATLGQSVGLVDKPVGVEDNFMDRWNANTDIYRDIYKEAREASPIASGLADFAGGFATPGLGMAGTAIKGGKLAKTVATAAGNALQGGISGAGYSDKDLKDISLTEDVLPSAALGGVIPLGIEGAKKVLPLAKGFTRILAGVNPRVADQVEKRIGSIRNLDEEDVLERVRTNLDKIKDNVFKQADDVSDQIDNARTNLQKQISKASSEGFEALSPDREVDISWVVKDLDEALGAKDIRGVRLSTESAGTRNALENLRDGIERVSRASGGKINELETKKMIQALDEIAYANPRTSGYTPKMIRDARALRRKLDDRLKKDNVPYQDASAEASSLINFADEFDDVLNVDNTKKLLSSVVALHKNPRLKANIDKLAQVTSNPELQSSVNDFTSKQELYNLSKNLRSSSESGQKGVEAAIRNLIPYDNTPRGLGILDDLLWGMNKSKISQAEKRNKASRIMLDAYSQLSGDDIIRDAEDMALRHHMNQTRLNGSRVVQALSKVGKAVVGGTLGSVFGPAGAAAGAVAGAARDVAGPRAYMKLIEILDAAKGIGNTPVGEVVTKGYQVSKPLLQNAIRLPAQVVERQNQINRDYFGRD